MGWIDETLDRLAAETPGGYHAGATAATEPTALAALALAAHRRFAGAEKSLAWLAEHQAADGSLGVTAEQSSPHWPTSLAAIAWTLAAEQEKYRPAADRAIGWLIGASGKPTDPVDSLGHDTTLVGWPWVADTHSWLEPTAFAVLALKSAGHGSHARAREGVRLLSDRVLADGGCNYGNTIVLGQQLRPHLQPTGIAMLALRGESDDGRIAKSLNYTSRELNASTATASLCWGLMGLAAHGPAPAESGSWLKAAWQRTNRRDPAPHKLALLALAASGAECPLVQLENPISSR